MNSNCSVCLLSTLILHKPARLLFSLFPKETRRNIISMSGDTGPSTGMAFFYTNMNTSSEGTNTLTVSLSNNRVWSLSSNPKLLLDWTHVTVTWHEAWGLKYYQNGNLHSETNKWTKWFGNETLAVASRIVIGGGESVTDAVASLGGNLQMSDLRIWERYISPSDVLVKYENTGVFFVQRF